MLFLFGVKFNSVNDLMHFQVFSIPCIIAASIFICYIFTFCIFSFCCLIIMPKIRRPLGRSVTICDGRYRDGKRVCVCRCVFGCACDLPFNLQFFINRLIAFPLKILTILCVLYSTFIKVMTSLPCDLTLDLLCWQIVITTLIWYTGSSFKV